MALQCLPVTVDDFFRTFQAAEDSKNFRLTGPCIVDKLGAFMWLPDYPLFHSALKRLHERMERICLTGKTVIGRYGVGV